MNIIVNEYAVCSSLTISLLSLAVSDCHINDMMCDDSEATNFVWKKCQILLINFN